MVKLINKEKIKEKNDLMKFFRKNLALILAIVYFFLPMDIIPDIFPAFGYGDDILVLLATLFIRYRRFSKSKNKEEILEGEIVNE